MAPGRLLPGTLVPKTWLPPVLATRTSLVINDPEVLNATRVILGERRVDTEDPRTPDPKTIVPEIWLPPASVTTKPTTADSPKAPLNAKGALKKRKANRSGAPRRRQKRYRIITVDEHRPREASLNTGINWMMRNEGGLGARSQAHFPFVGVVRGTEAPRKSLVQKTTDPETSLATVSVTKRHFIQDCDIIEKLGVRAETTTLETKLDQDYVKAIPIHDKVRDLGMDVLEDEEN